MATITLNPYLSFNGNAEEASNFYNSVFGGEVTLSRFSDTPGMDVAEDQKSLVMHGVLKTDELLLMFSDALPIGSVKAGDNVSVSLSGDNEANLTKYFKGLSNGGKVSQVLAVQAWGDTFGMVTDKFGIRWMVDITKSKDKPKDK